MTRRERILALAPVVQRCARFVAQRNRTLLGDELGWAWIAAIQVAETRIDLSGEDLAGVCGSAIKWRAIDRYRTRTHSQRNGRGPVNPIRTRRIYEESLPKVQGREFVSHEAVADFERVEARILLDQLRALLPPVEHGPHRTRASSRERAWKILWATVGEGKTDAEIGRLFGISETRVGNIAREMIEKLREASSAAAGGF